MGGRGGGGSGGGASETMERMRKERIDRAREAGRSRESRDKEKREARDAQGRDTARRDEKVALVKNLKEIQTTDRNVDADFINKFMTSETGGISKPLIKKGIVKGFSYDPKIVSGTKVQRGGSGASDQHALRNIVSYSDFKKIYGFSPGESMGEIKGLLRKIEKKGVDEALKHKGSSASIVAKHQRKIGFSGEKLGYNSIRTGLQNLIKWEEAAKSDYKSQYDKWEKDFGQYLGSEGTILASRFGTQKAKVKQETLLSGD